MPSSCPHQRNVSRNPAAVGPQADPAFTQIAAPEIRHRVRLAHLVYRIRKFCQRWLGRSLGNLVLALWKHDLPGARLIERHGLPRHNFIASLGRAHLILHVDPRELIQKVDLPRSDRSRHPSSMAFIWDGDWDLRRADLRIGFWLGYMRELDGNRNNLERTKKFKELMAELEAGKPFRSHQEGVYLNSRERILAYLGVYLGFLDDMAEHGYDSTRAKDHLGVAISREGRILKINRGLHRLGMAQWLGLPSIPVQVQHVHRQWWDKVTQGAQGEQALQRIREALPQCTPETARGPLTRHPPVDPDGSYWPAPRQGPSGNSKPR